MKRHHILLCLLVLVAGVNGQVVGSTTEMDDQFNQHASDELRKFGFWIGLWEFETQAPGPDGKLQNVSGTNRISLTFDGYGLHEDFNMGSGESQFSGGSVTSANPKTGEVIQVWVDNSGWHKTFIGGWDDAAQAMILYGPVEEIKGKKVQRRLVWRDIKEESMIWDYEMSSDEGKTWKSTWTLNYKRVSG